MKLLQNTVGNFLNMSPGEARAFAQKLLTAATDCETAQAGRGAGFVQTITLTERGSRDLGLDTVFVGVDKNWLDVHPTLEAGLQLRDKHTLHIDRNAVNARLK